MMGKFSSAVLLYTQYMSAWLQTTSDNKQPTAENFTLNRINTINMLVCQNTQPTPTHHLTKTLNYSPSTWDLNRNGRAAVEKVHCMNRADFTATAEENGLTFQILAAKTLHKSDMDLTMSGKLQEVKEGKKKKKTTAPSLLETSALISMTGT